LESDGLVRILLNVAATTELTGAIGRTGARAFHGDDGTSGKVSRYVRHDR
jgi:hypothetical protein